MVSVHDVMTFWIAQGVTMAMNARDIAAQERDVDSHASLSSSIWKKIGVLLCKEMSFENEIFNLKYASTASLEHSALAVTF